MPTCVSDQANPSPASHTLPESSCLCSYPWSPPPADQNTLFANLPSIHCMTTWKSTDLLCRCRFKNFSRMSSGSPFDKSSPKIMINFIDRKELKHNRTWTHIWWEKYCGPMNESIMSSNTLPAKDLSRFSRSWLIRRSSSGSRLVLELGRPKGVYRYIKI